MDPVQDSATSPRQKIALPFATPKSRFFMLARRYTTARSTTSSHSLPSTKECSSTHFTYGDKCDSGYSPVFDTQTGVELQRHSDLWFYDGSLVCRAENTLFRVHMSLLARHSVCFSDMLAIPQPNDELDETTGFDLSKDKGWRESGSVGRARIPIIVLHDTAEDVENLLKALIDGP